MEGGDEELASLVARLEPDEARALLVRAAEWHEDVARTVRLAAAVGGLDRLKALRVEVDQSLRTRRFLGYWESSAWATDATPVVEALAREVESAPSQDLVFLLERAVGHLIKVILRADDSNGMIGGLARDVLDLHARSCDAAVADPVRLAKWMVRFTFDDQDFFMVDPVRYAAALGERGLAAYRREVSKRTDNAIGDRSFAGSYALERLAVLDRDGPQLIALLGGNLTNAYQYARVAEAMIEIGDVDAALDWARRGIAQTSGWQVAKLYDLAVGLLANLGDTTAVLDMRREQHQRLPSAATYGYLHVAAVGEARWEAERPSARELLAERDPGGLIDVLLADGEPEAAWVAAVGNPSWALGDQRWQRLAEAREPADPSGAMDVHLRLAESALRDANRNAYQAAVRHLRAAQRAANSADRSGDFHAHIVDLRERHRRRPTLITMLDKAKLR